MKTRKMKVKIYCDAYYESEIEIPVNLDLEESIDYAEKHIDDIPLGELEYVPYSDELNRDYCYFEMED